jgi:hypothetical protein
MEKATILVTGSTGGTGSETVSQLLKKGHRVRALAHNPLRLPDNAERFERPMPQSCTVAALPGRSFVTRRPPKLTWSSRSSRSNQALMSSPTLLNRLTSLDLFVVLLHEE